DAHELFSSAHQKPVLIFHFYLYVPLQQGCQTPGFEGQSLTVLKCQCLRTSKTVQPSLIKKVQEFPPRPYCSKLEIIITLKNNVKVCLDPTHKFAKAVLESTKV
uniref:Chemokine interleukin-8-like domain-containing protein n=1 Tax=Oryzias latipes TaxID=8090 RepID=A0A3P9ITF3_ORYLA